MSDSDPPGDLNCSISYRLVEVCVVAHIGSICVCSMHACMCILLLLDRVLHMLISFFRLTVLLSSSMFLLTFSSAVV